MINVFLFHLCHSKFFLFSQFVHGFVFFSFVFGNSPLGTGEGCPSTGGEVNIFDYSEFYFK